MKSLLFITNELSSLEKFKEEKPGLKKRGPREKEILWFLNPEIGFKYIIIYQKERGKTHNFSKITGFGREFSNQIRMKLVRKTRRNEET